MSELSFRSWNVPARWDCPGSGQSGAAASTSDKKSVHHFTAGLNANADTKIVLTPGCASADTKSGAITLTVHTASANAPSAHHGTCVWFKDANRCDCGAVGNPCAGANGTIVLRLESAPAKPPRSTEEVTNWMNAQFYDMQRYTAHAFVKTRDFETRLYRSTAASAWSECRVR